MNSIAVAAQRLTRPVCFAANKMMLVLLFSGVVASQAQAPVQTEARHYLVLTVNVPFQFTVGERTLNGGLYKFVVLGPGLLGVLNTKTREAVHLITRDLPLTEAPATTQLIFTNGGKRRRLTSIQLSDRAQSLQIMGEEMAVRQSPPQVEPLTALDRFPRGKPPLLH